MKIFAALSLALVASGLKEGEYAPPRPSDIRSPCPLLNTAANHGYFPRNGAGLIPKAKVVEVLSRFNIAPALSDRLVKGLKRLQVGDGETLSLQAISKIGAIEHYASLVHDDAPGDVLKVNQTLVDELVSFANGAPTLSLVQLAKFRAKRQADSAANTPNYALGFSHQMFAFGESAVLASVFGNEKLEIPVETIKTFLGKEQIPKGFKPLRESSLASALGIIVRLKAYSLVPWDTLHMWLLEAQSFYFKTMDGLGR
ncbi:hypothetical protein HDU91_007294 [Kappamyces sp. JEL0680]|nr:hypothetical protein HDU91_007294 [Kappamyces sp. JEL0680]